MTAHRSLLRLDNGYLMTLTERQRHNGERSFVTFSIGASEYGSHHTYNANAADVEQVRRSLTGWLATQKLADRGDADSVSMFSRVRTALFNPVPVQATFGPPNVSTACAVLRHEDLAHLLRLAEANAAPE